MNHPQFLHWCNALSSICSVVTFVVMREFNAFYENFGAELPFITEFFFNLSTGLLLIPFLACILSVYAYIRHGKKIRLLKLSSIGLLLFTIVFSVLSLLAMYIPSMCHCKVII